MAILVHQPQQYLIWLNLNDVCLSLSRNLGKKCDSILEKTVGANMKYLVDDYEKEVLSLSRLWWLKKFVLSQLLYNVDVQIKAFCEGIQHNMGVADSWNS